MAKGCRVGCTYPDGTRSKSKVLIFGIMKAFSFKEPWLNSHVDRLLNLSEGTKRALIRVLERSMVVRPKKGDEQEKERDRKLAAFWSACGAWEGDGTADELAAAIREARVDTPDREAL